MQKQKCSLVSHILGGHIIHSITETGTQDTGRRRKSFSDVCGIFGGNGAGEIALLCGVNEKNFHLHISRAMCDRVFHEVPDLERKMRAMTHKYAAVIECLCNTAKMAADLDNENNQKTEVV